MIPDSLIRQISEEQVNLISALTSAIFGAQDGHARIEELVDTVKTISEESHYNPILIRDVVSVIIEHLCSSITPSVHDDLDKCFDLLSLLNHVPIKSQSVWNRPTIELIRALGRRDHSAEEDFETLQLIMILNEIEDYGSAGGIIWQHHDSDSGTDLLDLVYNIEHTRMLSRQDKLLDHIKCWVTLFYQVYHAFNYDCAIWVIFCWLSSCAHLKNSEHKKQLLQKVYNEYQGKQSLLTAQILFELFDMENRLLSPIEKMGYFVKLQNHSPASLKVQQLQQMYFFAGNYSSGFQSRFKESIKYYQLSNYYLHKSWESLRNISAFLRDHLSERQYYQVMHFVEIKMQHFSNLLSLQSNAYVENLQTNFSKIEKLYKKVEELSLTDSLTGLRNRRYLENNLYHMIMLAARQKVPIGFAMIDIDHFKVVNDAYGHLGGDFVLEELAAIIISFFRKSDIIVRYGGEEFFVVLFDSSQSRTMDLMSCLREHVEHHIFEHEDKQIHITISIGISCHTFKDHQWDPDLITIIGEVDEALYKAKTSGRNQIIIHQNEIHT